VEKAAACYAARRKETARTYSKTENLVDFRYWNYTGRLETVTTAEDIKHEILLMFLKSESNLNAEFLNRYISKRIKGINRKRNAKHTQPAYRLF
jgi:hypothetical protein